MQTSVLVKPAQADGVFKIIYDGEHEEENAKAA